MHQNFSNLRNRRPNNMGAQLNGNPVNGVPLILSPEERAAMKEQHDTEAAASLIENAVQYRNQVVASIIGSFGHPIPKISDARLPSIQLAKQTAEETCVAMGLVPSVDVFRDVDAQLAKRHPKMVELLKQAVDDKTE